MLQDLHSKRSHARWSWYAPSAAVESLLFVAVGAMVFAYTLLAAAQLLGTA